MRIIAQKTDILNNEEFIKNATTKDYIYGITINVALTKDNKILIPAAGMVKTEANIKENNKVKMTLGSKEVQGHFTQGAGFRLEGTAKFISLGEEYDMMKEKFPFLTRVLEITLTEIEQTL